MEAITTVISQRMLMGMFSQMLMGVFSLLKFLFCSVNYFFLGLFSLFLKKFLLFVCFPHCLFMLEAFLKCLS